MSVLSFIKKQVDTLVKCGKEISNTFANGAKVAVDGMIKVSVIGFLAVVIVTGVSSYFVREFIDKVEADGMKCVIEEVLKCKE